MFNVSKGDKGNCNISKREKKTMKSHIHTVGQGGQTLEMEIRSNLCVEQKP